MTKALSFVLLVVLARGVAACMDVPSRPPTTLYEAVGDCLEDGMAYVIDPDTNYCFSACKSRTYGGSWTITTSRVACEPVTAAGLPLFRLPSSKNRWTSPLPAQEAK